MAGQKWRRLSSLGKLVPLAAILLVLLITSPPSTVSSTMMSSLTTPTVARNTMGEAAMIECREYPRIPTDLQVFFSTDENPVLRQGTMFDVSVGGCAVASTAPVEQGAGVRLLIRATALGSPITVEAAAVRWAKHGEFGVEFLNLTELDRNRLRRFLHVTRPHTVRHH